MTSNGKAVIRNKKKPARRSSSRASHASRGIFPVLNGVLFAAAVTVALIMILAVFLKFGIVKDSVIPLFNQILKVVCIALAAFLAVRGISAHPWFRGLLAGALYVILGAVVFSLIVGSFSFSIANLADIGMGIVIGAIVGFVFGTKTGDKSA